MRVPSPQYLLRFCVLASAILTGCDRGPSADEYFERAVAREEAGDLRAAVIELKNTLQKDPEHAEARWRLGRAYVRFGNGPAAEKELERAIQNGVDRPEASIALTHSLLLQERYREVLERLEAAPGDWPPGMVDVLAGTALLGLQRVDEAEAKFQDVAERVPDLAQAHRGLATIAMQRLDFDAASAHLDDALQRAPEDLLVLLLKGRLELYRRDFDAAEKAYGTALRAAPELPAADNGMARIQLIRRNLDDAQEHVASLDESLGAKHPLVGHLEALLDYYRGDQTSARAHLSDVLAANPNYLESLFLMATLHYAAGQFQQAQELAARFTARAPGYVFGHKLLALVHMQLGNYSEAVAEIEVATRITPDDPLLYALIGNAHMLARDYGKAIEALREAVEIAPESALLRADLARNQLTVGHTAEAIVELESAVDLDQEFSQADFLLMVTHLRSRDYEASIETGERLLAKEPDNPVALTLVATGYEGVGRLDEAREHYEKASEIAPNYGAPKLGLASLDLGAGDRDSAFARYEEIFSDPRSDLDSFRTAVNFLAQNDGRERRPADAKRRYERLLERSEHDPDALGALATLAADEGRVEDGAALLEQARKHNPNALAPRLMLASYHLRNFNARDGLAVAQEARSIAPDNLQVLLLLGLAQTANSRVENAFATYKHAAELYPNAAGAHFELAKAALQADDDATALTALERTLELNESHAKAREMLGRFHLASNDVPAALAVAADMQKRDPGSPGGFVLEGDIHMSDGAPRRAVASYERALAIVRTVSLIARQFRARWQSGDRAGANALFDGWIAENPRDTAIRVARASVLEQQGLVDEAIAAYEQVLELDPDSAAALNNLALLFHARGDAGALELAKRANAAAPSAAPILDTYGWLLVERDQNEKGLVLLRKANALAPDDPAIGFHLAAGLVKSGDVKSAREILESLLAGDREFEQRLAAETLLQQLRAF